MVGYKFTLYKIGDGECEEMFLIGEVLVFEWSGRRQL